MLSFVVWGTLLASILAFLAAWILAFLAAWWLNEDERS